MADNVDTNPADSGPNTDLSSFEDLSGKFSDDTEKSTYENKRNLKYPNDMNSGQDRITITQLQYVAGLSITSDTSSTISGDSRFNGTKTKSLGTVTLPMPNDISESNTVGWGEDSLSNMAALAMPGLLKSALAVGEGNAAEALEGLTQSAKQAIFAPGTKVRAQQLFAANAAAGLLKKINVNVNPEAYIARATGAALNPNMELLFNGPKLRQFSFQFKLTPRSQDEAKSIRGIIQFFKKGMAPRKSTDKSLNFFLGTPNVFKIKFKSGSGELKSIGKIKTCALTSFNVNYTADGFYAAYEDSDAGGSQPISVMIQLGFSELTPVYSDEHELTDDNVNLGPTKSSDVYNLTAGSTDTDTTETTSSSTPTEQGGGNPYQGTGGPPTPTEQGGGNPYQGTRGNNNNNPYGS